MYAYDIPIAPYGRARRQLRRSMREVPRLAEIGTTEHHYVEYADPHEWNHWPQTQPIASWKAIEIEAMAA